LLHIARTFPQIATNCTFGLVNC